MQDVMCTISNREKFIVLKTSLAKPKHLRTLNSDLALSAIEHCILVNGAQMFDNSDFTTNPMQTNACVDKVLSNYRMLKRYPEYYKMVLKFI